MSKPPLPDASQRLDSAEPAPLTELGLGPECPLVVLAAELSADSPIGADMHVSLELGIVVAGTRHEDHGRGWFRLGAGQAWAVASLEPHQWRIGSRGAEIVLFEVLPSLFAHLPNLAGLDPAAPFRSDARFGPIGTGRRWRRALADLGRELMAKHRSPVPPGPCCVDLLRVLEHVATALPRDEPSRASDQRRPFDASRVYPAIEQLARVPSRIVGTTEAARRCRMSRTTFRRSFKEVTGLSFGQFELRWRLARAAHQLRATTDPIKAIAYRFGFTDASHFHHAFAAHYRMPPGRYRRTPPR